jgi:predicted TIM-barrel fold metal-dependent hydrolase
MGMKRINGDSKRRKNETKRKKIWKEPNADLIQTNNGWKKMSGAKKNGKKSLENILKKN